MRKREVEKLLYNAVAEALGVEAKAPRRTFATKARTIAGLRKAPRDDHRAAA